MLAVDQSDGLESGLDGSLPSALLLHSESCIAARSVRFRQTTTKNMPSLDETDRRGRAVIVNVYLHKRGVSARQNGTDLPRTFPFQR